MRRPFLIAVLFLAALGAATSLRAFAQSAAPLATPNYATTACSNPRLPVSILGGSGPYQRGSALKTITLAAPAEKLTLAVAATESDRELGLMCVTSLAPHHGMIFVFPSAAQQGFWMKLTLIPLDMVWLAPDGTVTSVAANVPASTLDTSEKSVARRYGQGQYVVELRAGEAQSDGIKKGVKFSLPVLHGVN
jgi:uncharacterized membrane protein (UPF0127 family)